MNHIDHLVVAAASLAEGMDYIRQTLDVDIPKGGFHATMGTCNHLMQLGNDSYLEVIAIDPSAKAPQHPRWFGLDDQLMRNSLRQSPRLITWAMNTDNLVRVKRQAGIDIGIATELQRDQLRWQIALTDDGRLLGGGALPYVIQWLSQPHPSSGMADLGCRLKSLELHHNRADWLNDMLESFGADELVTVHAINDSEVPYLLANIETPSGMRTLSSIN